MQPDRYWLALGLLGQLLFSGRFLVQWIASERLKASVVPRSFWYLSLAGGATLLGYAIFKRDPVFILGQSAGLLIYGRNLWLTYRPGAR
ncbi:MAG TPA: lipid-A-disaccharide synthase N-terminal domain-containing protein [Thermoanaerobaculia bacterium]|nr:lipid-A-disaccharide synthase N-terminal domain-containing protein [Thermoanaerobaculia bacterium]